MSQDLEWSCPKCGTTVHFISEATQARFIEDHNHWHHAGSLDDPPLVDHSFYDGGRLSDTDVTFLRGAKICWNNPRS